MTALRETNPDKQALIDTLAHQLVCKQRMDTQLQRFYDQMEQ